MILTLLGIAAVWFILWLIITDHSQLAKNAKKEHDNNLMKASYDDPFGEKATAREKKESIISSLSEEELKNELARRKQVDKDD